MRSQRDSGFTIVEVLFSAVIAAALAGILAMSFLTGESAQRVGAVQIDLQSEVRRAVDWVVSDTRKTVAWDIGAVANTPSDTHIKFRVVEGFNSTGETFLMSPDYIEYTYDAGAQVLTRRTLDGATNATTGIWYFNNITAAPFYNSDMTALSSPGIMANRNFIVDVRGSRPVQGGPDATYNLTAEIKIRNG
jgi:type II secretory pathway pseudopilin PulG